MIVERSGNHCHLTQETFKKLFGYDEMTVKRRLLNENYFVAKEDLYIEENGDGVGLSILGPFRKYNQIECARSEPIARDWPSAESGEGEYNYFACWSSGGKVERVKFKNIVSKPHAHLRTEAKEKWEQNCIIKLNGCEVKGKAYFDNRITVDTIHLDNDWYNAMNVTEGSILVL
jgi:propanediol utilization protein